MIPTDINHCLDCGNPLYEVGYEHPADANMVNFLRQMGYTKTVNSPVHIFKLCINSECKLFGLLQVGKEVVFNLMAGGKQVKAG